VRGRQRAPQAAAGRGVRVCAPGRASARIEQSRQATSTLNCASVARCGVLRSPVLLTSVAEVRRGLHASMMVGYSTKRPGRDEDLRRPPSPSSRSAARGQVALHWRQAAHTAKGTGTCNLGRTAPHMPPRACWSVQQATNGQWGAQVFGRKEKGLSGENHGIERRR